MSTPRTTNRGHHRQSAVLYRVSPENREILKQRAQEAGFSTLQDWLDAKLLGDLAPKCNQQELPLTAS